jgi:hypothetical protein
MLWSGAVIADSGLRIEAPWARATAPTAQTGAAYFLIRGGGVEDRLLGASSAVAERVELHTHTMSGGMMQMRQVPDVSVAAGQAIEFRPGGLHVMLIGLKAPLAAGASFEVALQFEKAGTVRVPVEVRGVGATGAEKLPPGKAHGHSH